MRADAFPPDSHLFSCFSLSLSLSPAVKETTYEKMAQRSLASSVLLLLRRSLAPPFPLFSLISDSTSESTRKRSRGQQKARQQHQHDLCRREREACDGVARHGMQAAWDSRVRRRPKEREVIVIFFWEKHVTAYCVLTPSSDD